jgi:two-component system cell cycle response regulator
VAAEVRRRRASDLPKLRILLVEDDPDDVVVFGELLGRVAPMSHVDHVESPAEARRRLGSADYDLCFFDYQLGEETGVDLLRMVRADGYDRPIIMLTGHGDEAVAVTAMKAGATDYLSKRGLDVGLLGAAVRHATALYETERRRQRIERALRLSEQRYRELVDRLPVIVGELAAESGETRFVNQAASRVTGYTADELVGQDFWRLLAPGLDDDELGRLRRRVLDDGLDGHELAARHKDGRALTLEWSTAVMRGSAGAPETIVCIGMDVTERVRMRDELTWLAVRDELTGLSNRRGFLTLADQQLKAAVREKQAMLAVFVNIDGLESINEQLGHAEGDRALRDMADVMRRTFRGCDVIGRIGGDEFVALVAEGSPFRSDGIIQRLQTALARFNAGEARGYYLSASIGAARYDPGAPVAIDNLVNRTESEMSENKLRRRHRDVVRKATPVPAV